MFFAGGGQSFATYQKCAGHCGGRGTLIYLDFLGKNHNKTSVPHEKKGIAKRCDEHWETDTVSTTSANRHENIANKFEKHLQGTREPGDAVKIMNKQ